MPKIKPATTLTSDQETALSQLKNFTNSPQKFFRLTGYAGTGKSFLIAKYIRWPIDLEIAFVVATPTNKAAKNLVNLAEIEGLELKVKTIAQLLKQQPEIDEETGKEIFQSIEELDWSGYGIIIIDEFSMVNRENYLAIAKQIKSSLFSKVVFVGDAAQIPPVGESSPLIASSSDIESSATLDKVVRYEGEIALVAERIRNDPKYSRTIYPFTTSSDRSIVSLPRTEWMQKAISLFQSQEYRENPDYIRLLAWRNQTVDFSNDFVRKQLWGENVLDYIPGDRLIAKRPLFRVIPGLKGKEKWKIVLNNSEEASVIEPGILCESLFEGHIYQYWKVKVRKDSEKELLLSILHRDSKKVYEEQIQTLVRQKRWQNYFDLSRMFDDMAYAFGLTVHKSQGSTIDYVFLDAADLRGSSDRQKLQYTALTRVKKQLFVNNG